MLQIFARLNKVYLRFFDSPLRRSILPLTKATMVASVPTPLVNF